MAKSATRQVSIFINGKEVENTIKSIAAEQVKLNNTIKGMVRGTDEYEEKVRDLQKVNGIITEHNQRLKGVQQGWSLAKIGVDKLVGVAAGAFAVDSLLTYGKQLYGVGVAMDTLQRKAQIVFGTSLPQVTAEADKNATSIGLTTAQYVSAAAAIQDLLVPMGFQRKEAAAISTQLVNLSGALSEWTGGQIKADEVSKIITKSLLGEREQLEQLGIKITEADVKAQLAAKGFDKLTGAALEQAKATATLELIMAKSVDAQTAFANNSDSAVRRQAENAAKIAEITEKLAALLLPVFEALADIAGVVVGAIGDVVDGISDMIGVQNKQSDATRESQTEFNVLVGILQNVNSTEDARNRAIEELKKNYGPYIGNVDLHKATEAQLNQVLIAGNELFVKRIFLQSQEEKLTEFAKKKLDLERELFEAQKETARLGAGGGGFNVSDKINRSLEEAKALKNELALLNFEQAEFVKNQEEFAKKLNILPSDKIEPTDTETGEGTGTGKSDTAIKEAERIQKELTALIERTTAMRLDMISKEQDDELTIAIRGIEKRYDATIKKAIELEGKGVQEATAQRVILEKLKQEEIGNAVKDYTEKSVAETQEQARKQAEKLREIQAEEFEKDNEQRAEFADGRQQAEDEIKAFKDETLLTAQEQELLQLEEHYKKLIALAKKYGIDTTGITKGYEADKTKILQIEAEKRKKVEEDIVEFTKKLQILKVNAIAEGASIIAGMLDQSSAVAKALFLVEKAAAAVSVVLSLQKEKAAIWASARAATAFDGTGLLTIALATPQITAANIRAGLSLGAIAATALKPFVKQKATGGVLSVTGADDGRTYNATAIGTPATGLLPHYPVLFNSNATNAPVLASERGAEYFVASQDLRNPYVANLVRMIDLATHGGRGISQFAEGGVNTTAAATGGAPLPAVDLPMIRELTTAINTLNVLLSRGIVAVVPDGTVLDINSRFAKLNAISGGLFQ